MKNLFVTLLFCVSLNVVTVFGQEKFTADRIVAVVGSQAILYSDVYENSLKVIEHRTSNNFTSDRSPMDEALEGLLLQKLLYQQAKIDSLAVNAAGVAQAADAQIEKMIQETGSTAEVEKEYKKPIFNIREELKAEIEEMGLAQQMQESVKEGVQVIPGEVDRYYRNIDKDSLPIIPDQYIFAQIVKLPTSTEEAKVRVREQLLEMRKRIIDGTKFDLLARMYSVDGSAMRGGEMDPTPKEGFVTPFANALANLQVGQVSEVVETEFGFHLIELLEKNGNLYRCRHILLRPTFSTNELLETNALLDSILNEVKTGTLTFEQAAYDHSDDKYSKLNGGIVSNHEMLEAYGAFDPTLSSTKFLTEELFPADYNMLKDLEVGEISKAFQTQDLRGNTISKAVKLIDIIPSHTADLKNDYLRVESLALKQKQNREFDAWLAKKIKTMYIHIDDEFKNAQFENKHWLD